MSDDEVKFEPKSQPPFTDKGEIPYDIKKYIPLDERRPDATILNRGMMIVILIVGIIAVSTMLIYMHEVWALDNPELGDERNIGIFHGKIPFYISYFKSEQYEIIQIYDCTPTGLVTLGTQLHKSVGVDKAYHFIFELPERENVGKSEFTIYNELVTYCEDNPRTNNPLTSEKPTGLI